MWLLIFSSIEGILSYEQKGRVHYIVAKDNDVFKQIMAKVKTQFIEEIDLSLEDMFIYSTGGIEDGE